MTNTKNLFEIALRGKYRFNYKGVLTTEDLLMLSVEELDTIFKSLNKELKQVEEESLLATKSAEDTVLENKIALVKLIVEEKLTAFEIRAKAQEAKKQKNKLAEILAAKEDEELKGKSADELREMIKAIENQ